MAERERRTTRVSCSVPNGVELRLFDLEHDFDDGSGLPNQPARQTGSIVLKGPDALATGVGNQTGAAVENEVDAEQWEGWLEANGENFLVLSGAVRAVEERDDAEDE